MKEGSLDEIVEVEVPETVEEKVEEEVEETLVEEKAVGVGKWLRVFTGARMAGSIVDLPLGPADVAGPHTLTP